MFCYLLKEKLGMLFLFVAFLVLFTCYFWPRYSGYFKLPCNFFIVYHLLQWPLLKKAYRDSFGSYLYRKSLEVFKGYEKVGMCIVWVPSPMLFVFGEEPMKFLLNEETLIKKPELYHFAFPEEYSSILVSGGEKWKNERRLIAPAFKISVLREMASTMNHHAEALVEDLSRLSGKTIGNTLELVKLNAIRQFYESAVGFATAAEEIDERAWRLMEITERYLKIVSGRVVRPWLHINFIWKMSPLSKQYAKCFEEITSLIMEIFPRPEQRTTLRQHCSKGAFVEEGIPEESNPRNCETLGDILMDMHLKDYSSFTKEDLISQLFTVMVAGFDTSTNATAWTLWLLGLHPDVQEEAYAEIASKTDQFVTFDDARKLCYLECVIKESLRLYSTGSYFARTSDRDIQFGKYRIPKDTTIVFVPSVLHRNPDIYPDPESFNPDRFRDTTSSKIPWSYVPFAEGVRSCIGKNYAMLQMKIFLAHALRNFRVVSLGRREDVLETWEVVLKPATPLQLKFVRR